jgi:hypothetical protein
MLHASEKFSLSTPSMSVATVMKVIAPIILNGKNAAQNKSRKGRHLMYGASCHLLIKFPCSQESLKRLACTLGSAKVTRFNVFIEWAYDQILGIRQSPHLEPMVRRTFFLSALIALRNRRRAHDAPAQKSFKTAADNLLCASSTNRTDFL